MGDRGLNEKTKTFVFNKKRLAGCFANIMANLATPKATDDEALASYRPVVEPVSPWDNEIEPANGSELGFCIHSVRGQAADLDPFLMPENSIVPEVSQEEVPVVEVNNIVPEDARESPIVKKERSGSSRSKYNFDPMFDKLESIEKLSVRKIAAPEKPKLPETLLTSGSDEEAPISVSTPQPKKSRKNSPRKIRKSANKSVDVKQIVDVKQSAHASDTDSSPSALNSRLVPSPEIKNSSVFTFDGTRQLGLFGSNKGYKKLGFRIATKYSDGSMSSGNGSASDSDVESTAPAEPVEPIREKGTTKSVVLYPSRFTGKNTSAQQKDDCAKRSNVVKKKKTVNSSSMLSGSEEEAQKRRLEQEIPGHNWLENKINSGDMSIKPPRRSSTHLPINAPPQRTLSSGLVAIAVAKSPAKQTRSPIAVAGDNTHVSLPPNRSCEEVVNKSAVNVITFVATPSLPATSAEHALLIHPAKLNVLTPKVGEPQTVSSELNSNLPKQTESANDSAPGTSKEPIKIAKTDPKSEKISKTDQKSENIAETDQKSENIAETDQKSEIIAKPEEQSEKIKKSVEIASDSDDVMIVHEVNESTRLTEEKKRIVFEEKVMVAVPKRVRIPPNEAPKTVTTTPKSEPKKAICEDSRGCSTNSPNVNNQSPDGTHCHLSPDVLNDVEQLDLEYERYQSEVEILDKMASKCEAQRENFMLMKKEKEMTLRLMDEYKKLFVKPNNSSNSSSPKYDAPKMATENARDPIDEQKNDPKQKQTEAELTTNTTAATLPLPAPAPAHAPIPSANKACHVEGPPPCCANQYPAQYPPPPYHQMPQHSEAPPQIAQIRSTHEQQSRKRRLLEQEEMHRKRQMVDEERLNRRRHEEAYYQQQMIYQAMSAPNSHRPVHTDSPSYHQAQNATIPHRTAHPDANLHQTSAQNRYNAHPPRTSPSAMPQSHYPVNNAPNARAHQNRTQHASPQQHTVHAPVAAHQTPARTQTTHMLQRTMLAPASPYQMGSHVGSPSLMQQRMGHGNPHAQASAHQTQAPQYAMHSSHRQSNGSNSSSSMQQHAMHHAVQAQQSHVQHGMPHHTVHHAPTPKAAHQMSSPNLKDLLRSPHEAHSYQMPGPNQHYGGVQLPNVGQNCGRSNEHYVERANVNQNVVRSHVPSTGASYVDERREVVPDRQGQQSGWYPTPQRANSSVHQQSVQHTESEEPSINRCDLLCFNCHNKASLYCTLCRSVCYCSEACQAANWVIHESKCKLLTMRPTCSR